MSIPEISVHELALRLADHDPNLQLIDVREPEEVAMASVANFTILPLSQYREWSPTIASQFNPQAETLVICHHGMNPCKCANGYKVRVLLMLKILTAASMLMPSSSILIFPVTNFDRLHREKRGVNYPLSPHGGLITDY